MFRRIFAALAVVVAASLPAAAFDIGAMTDQERAAFRDEIRAYLLDNPEVLMEAIAVLEERRATQAQAEEDALIEQYRAEIFEDGFSFVGGNPDGDVTIVEFMDYRCSFCKRAFPEVEELLASDGNIRFIVKEFPILGEASLLGARYAIAVQRLHGDAVYKVVHDTLMTMRSDLNDTALERVSEMNALDHDALVAEMGSAEITDIIARNRALASQLRIEGTPTFIMGETFVRGYLELDKMRALVDAIRRDQS